MSILAPHGSRWHWWGLQPWPLFSPSISSRADHAMFLGPTCRIIVTSGVAFCVEFTLLWLICHRALQYISVYVCVLDQ